MNRFLRYALIVVALLFLASRCVIADDSAGSADGKILVVMLFDDKCKVWCAQTRPKMHDLKEAYGDKLSLSELDTTQSVLSETKKKARELGVLSKIIDSIDYVPVVLIFDDRRKLAADLPGPKKLDQYKAIIDKLIARAR